MKVFLVGIGGVGMSSIAGLFYQNGYKVYGSDTNFYPPVDKILKKMNAKIFNSYEKKNIPDDIDFCVIGNIVSRGNPEAEYILNTNIEYYSMSEALYKFFIKGKKSVVVAGTHGKTTISSFISHLFDYAGLKPGFFIGGKPLNFESNYSVGSGEYFVVEGDEYETSFFDRSSKFLKYHPLYLILTSLEYDHIDFFSDEGSYVKSFKNLVNQVPSNGIIIMNGDFKMNRKVVEKSLTPVITYGSKNADYLIKNIELKNNQYQFILKNQSNEMKFRTSLLGKYNIWNLSSGIILGLHLGIQEKVIREAVETFKGVDRRLRIINKVKNTLFLEDFAHHPTSIKNSLESLKELYPEKRIICTG
jgi:UDP-N-acetylmuramate: L-alanyl-gamma-D-glutamyl-meso-diaminopimelate ligase